MAKKSKEKPKIEIQEEQEKKIKEEQEKIKKELKEEITQRKDVEDLRKRYLAKEDIKKVEKQELGETKKRIWGDGDETDLDAAREELTKELAKGESVEGEKSASAPSSASAEATAGKSAEAMADKQEFTPENLTVEKVEKMIRKKWLIDDDLDYIANLKIKTENGTITEQDFIREIEELIGCGKHINNMLEKGLLSPENLTEIIRLRKAMRASEISEQKFAAAKNKKVEGYEEIIKEHKISKQDFENRIQEMIEQNKKKQEKLFMQKELERESKETEKEEFKRDLLSAIRSPIQDLVLADNRIEKYDKKIKELQKGIIKPMRAWRRKKDIEQLKQISIENKEESLEAIEKIEDEYTLAGFSKNFSAKEIRKIIQDEIREARGEKQGEAMLEKENFETAEFKDYVDITGQEHSDTTKQEGHVDITGQENFDTTKSAHLDATTQGQPIDAGVIEQRAIEQREQTQHLRRDKIKRGAIKAGKGAKIGAGLFGLFWPTVAGAWLKFSSWFTTEVGKGEKTMMPKDIKEKKEKK